MGILFGKDRNVDRLRYGIVTGEPEWSQDYSDNWSPDVENQILVSYDVPAGKKGLCYGFVGGFDGNPDVFLWYIDINGVVQKKTICRGLRNNTISEIYYSPIAEAYPVKSSSNVLMVGGTGTSVEKFYYPTGICTDGTYLYVTDSTNNRIVKLLLYDLSWVSNIGTLGSGNDEFDSPFCMCTDNIYLYIVDTLNCRVVKRLCSDLSYDSEYGVWGSGDDELSYPYGICIDDSGYLYISDSDNCRVVKRNSSDLSYVDQVGSSGYGNLKFNFPMGITTDGTYVYISDNFDNKITKLLCSNLSFINKVSNFHPKDYIGWSGTGDEEFYMPEQIYECGGYLYIADLGNGRVVKKRSSDLTTVECIPLGYNGFTLDAPTGVLYHGGFLYISDWGSNMIFKISELNLMNRLHSIWITASGDYNQSWISLLMSYVEV